MEVSIIFEFESLSDFEKVVHGFLARFAQGQAAVVIVEIVRYGLIKPFQGLNFFIRQDQLTIYQLELLIGLTTAS